MSGWLLIGDSLTDLEGLGDGLVRMTARDWIERPPSRGKAPVKLINFARSFAYQSDGYYASLLAEARGHKAIPSVETMLALAGRAGYSHALPELEDILNRELARALGPAARPTRLLVCFGKADHAGVPRFARTLFDWFRAPVLTVSLRTREGVTGRWTFIARIAASPVHRLRRWQQGFLAAQLGSHTRQAWREGTPRKVLRHSLAVLVDPAEALPPSSLDSLRWYAREAARDNVEVIPVRKNDLARLAEHDALFIRETTSIRNHTWTFATRARAEAMPVIDDPVSMIRCTNKLYLHERLIGAGLPVPDTMIVRPDTDLSGVADRLGLPVVLKIPDGSFSRGVKKADTLAALIQLAAALFADTDLILAQRFTPSAFDWRVGVLGGEALFAARYLMARGHWQVIRHRDNGKAVVGRAEAVSLVDAPAQVLDTAVRAAALIGDGLYGVDLKETPHGPVVIEINDNPDINHGIEDAAQGAALWRRLTGWFVDRIGR